MHGKENSPKRVKNTVISFPLIKPEPITVPKIARIAANEFFTKIIYY